MNGLNFRLEFFPHASAHISDWITTSHTATLLLRSLLLNPKLLV